MHASASTNDRTVKTVMVQITPLQKKRYLELDATKRNRAAISFKYTAAEA